MTGLPVVLPCRAVIDPNVFVSALMTKPGSAALTTAQALATDHLILVACPYLLAELSEVAKRTKFRQYFSVEQAELLVAALALKAEMHPDPPTGPRVCADPDDDYLFALAAVADVPLVVSGDRKVLAVQLPSVDVLTPRQLVDRLDELIDGPLCPAPRQVGPGDHRTPL
ncbi:MAG: putative toxin-antitoxin system toxin component, PIN family [Pseudonocardiaceae bacterium]